MLQLRPDYVALGKRASSSVTLISWEPSSPGAGALRSSTDWRCLGSHTHQRIINLGVIDRDQRASMPAYLLCPALPPPPHLLSVFLPPPHSWGCSPAHPNPVSHLGHQGRGLCVSLFLELMHILSLSLCFYPSDFQIKKQHTFTCFRLVLLLGVLFCLFSTLLCSICNIPKTILNTFQILIQSSLQCLKHYYYYFHCTKKQRCREVK